MSCQNSKCSSNPCAGTAPVSGGCCSNNNSYLIIIVLYILLAIILGSWIWC